MGVVMDYVGLLWGVVFSACLSLMFTFMFAAFFGDLGFWSFVAVLLFLVFEWDEMKLGGVSV